MKKHIKVISALLVISFTFQYTAYPLTTEELQKQKQLLPEYSSAEEATIQTNVDITQAIDVLSQSSQIAGIEPTTASIGTPLVPLSTTSTSAPVPAPAGSNLLPTDPAPEEQTVSLDVPVDMATPTDLAPLPVLPFEPVPPMKEVGVTIIVEETVTEPTPGEIAQGLIDTDHDGQISLDELKTAYQGFVAALTTFDAKYDFNKDNKVDAADWDILKQVAKDAFPLAGDLNGDGKVTLDEIRRMSAFFLGNQGSLDEMLAADRNGDGKVGIGEVIMAINEFLKDTSPEDTAMSTVDKKLDGQITLDELKTAYQGFVAALTTFDAKYDFNKDNKVDAADWDILKQVAKDAFPLAGDLNGDGKVTLDEIRRMSAFFLGNQGSLDEMLAADRNGDGKVGIGEVIMAINEFLKDASPEDTAMYTVDKNLDGQISLDELKTAYQGFVATLTTFDAKYDFNKDNKVDAADWDILKQVAKDAFPLAGDLNGDGKVTLDEIRRMSAF